MTQPNDTFGHPTGPAQFNLFGEGRDRLQGTAQKLTPDPDVIRGRLQALLRKVQCAESMPWSAREARMWQTVFPNMAQWLPADEAQQLRLAFTTEMKRLDVAA